MPHDLRIHAPRDAAPRQGEFVLYWLQATMRAEDNFAFNHAVERANELGLPVLVYQGLRHDYPWASDRFHTFILESVADLAQAFEARGVQYAFHLDLRRSGDEPAGGDSPLVALARRAALVVTDFSPAFIFPRQLRGLRRRVEVPVVAVESLTVVPLRVHDREHRTARGMRPRLHEALPHFLHPVGTAEPEVRRAIDLPFEPVRPRDPSAADGPGEEIAALVARCDIDHSVPAVTGFRGGTRAARERLATFLERGLPRYVEQRDDPNEDATSRLSPWLHFGNISIHEVLLAAREAGPAGQYGKFEDEALVWRELAHNFAFHDPRHRTVDAIPDWARQELDDHAGDPREVTYTADQLERGETHDALWNACQLAYVREGWMHNYLRMLWGKSVLPWTGHYGEALRLLEHFNNRYSLDGRDPCTYGGIQWIFGKFDRPFYRRPVFGTVRYQSLKAARKKFDVDRYVARFA